MPDAVVKIEEDIIMIEEIKKLVETGKLKKIEEAVQEALDGGADPAEVLDSMTGAMDSVGEKFQKRSTCPRCWLLPRPCSAASTC